MDANLSLRTGTAAVVVPLLVLLIGWSPPWLFAVVLFILTAAALREYFAMAFPHRWQDQCVGVVFGLALSGGIFLSERLDLASWLGAPFLIVFSIYLFAPGTLNERLNRLLFTLLGGIYAGFLFPHWVVVFRHAHGRAWISWILLVIMIGDTVAYFVGRSFGYRKLAPEISPGKTVAGAWGYLAGAVFAGIAGAMLLFDRLSWVEISVLALMLGILGQLGDLFESWLKRVFEVKDSSQLLPGHGGLLDRLDSLIFPAVFMSTYLKVFHP
ncbi:MAG: phosphatidate cytidylyltransferase [Candidatus Binatia bacterium]